jgi:hypothetical protein
MHAHPDMSKTQSSTEAPDVREDIELRATGSVLTDTALEAVDEAYLEMTRGNTIKTVVAGFSFFFAGTNDGSLGPLTPYILKTYHVGTEYVALMYVVHSSHQPCIVP